LPDLIELTFLHCIYVYYIKIRVCNHIHCSSVLVIISPGCGHYIYRSWFNCQDIMLYLLHW